MTGPAPHPLTLTFGHDELVIRRRYEVASILNDLLVAAWFVVGSVLFFSDATATAGTWCFLFGSIELAVRPALRLARHLHLQRITTTPSTVGTGNDF